MFAVGLSFKIITFGPIRTMEVLAVWAVVFPVDSAPVLWYGGQRIGVRRVD